MNLRRAAFVLALLGSASFAAVLASSSRVPDGGPRVRSAPGPTASAPSARDDRAETVERYLRALAAFRAGEDSAETLLIASAKRLAGRYGRRDALDVARYYRTLGPEERVAGVALERRFDALRDEAVRLDENERAIGADREALLAQLEADLAAFLAEAFRAADITPAARCSSLLARLTVRRVERFAWTAREDEDDLLERAHVLATDACDRFERAGQRTPRLEPIWVLARVALLRGDGAEAGHRFEDLADLAVEVERPAWRERALLGSIGVARARGADFAVDEALRSLAAFRDPATCWALAREAAVQRLSHDEPERALEILDACPPSDEDAEIDLAVATEEWRALVIASELRAGHVEAAGAALVETSAPPGTTAGEVTELAEVALLLDLGEPRRALERLDGRDRDPRTSELGRVEALVLRGRALIELGRADAAITPLERAFAEGRRRDRERNLATARGSDDGALRDASAVGEWLGLSTVEALARAHVLRGDALRAGAVIEAAHAACSIEIAAGRLVALAERTTLGATTWIVGADGTTAVHVAPDGRAIGTSIPLGRREIGRAVGRLRDALTETRATGGADRSLGLRREIAEALLPEAVRRELEHAQVTPEGGPAPTYAILPHGVLERLPFESLVAGERERALGLDVAVAVARSLRDPDDVAEPLDGRSARWTAFGAPHAAGSVALEGARRELDSLDALHPRLTAHVGRAFERDRLARALEGTDPVHVATHVVRTPGGSLAAPLALLTGGGRLLTADDVAGLAPRLPLLVLVACGSADGPVLDGLGARGVAQAALDAGTRAAVVTLWPITDEHGRTASVALHAALLTGASPAEAVRRARATLKRTGAPPSEWASYRLLGLP
ncbi:MAG: CHAT domain-containing protein [Planctomycetota bacterium]